VLTTQYELTSQKGFQVVIIVSGVDGGGRSSESWLWAAGDMVRGPDVVTAVADGHRVAASIHAALIPQEKTA